MEQNTEPRNKSKHIWSDNFRQGHQEYTVWEKTVSSVNGVGQTGYAHAKE